MFTGLIQDIGIIRERDQSRADVRFEIETNMTLEDIAIGASICCSGCCLSVVEKTQNTFSVDVSKESLDKTNLSEWKTGGRVNLEPSLKLGDELGGHMVSGHVDTTTKILNITPEGDSYRIKVEIPDELRSMIASKGSIAIDGISLTVNEVEDTYFGVNIIPITWSHTTLGDRQAGDQVNLEIDMLARYVARQLEVKLNA